MKKEKKENKKAVPEQSGNSAALAQDFYTVNELAVVLRVNPQTVYRLERRGELKSYTIGHGGKAKRFRRCDIEAFLARCDQHNK